MADKGTVLVVDNESDQLDMMKEILERCGFEARTTDNPLHALKMVQQEAFTLVLIDLIMPEIDGTDLCEQIKRVRPALCVYAYSGHAHLYDSERLTRVGFDGTVNKPATMEELMAALSRSNNPQATAF